MPPAVTLVMPYHNAAQMLAVHAARWCTLPLWVKRRLEICVCDDASTLPIDNGDHRNTEDGATLRLFRIEPPHIPWSHRCATNVAAHHATGEWLLITDIDHVVPSDTWEYIMTHIATEHADPSRAYTFQRLNSDGSRKNSHPDSWLIHRNMWALIGGYDTRYRGTYGQNGPFIDRVQKYARVLYLIPRPLIRFSRDDIADASMPADYPRKSDEARREMSRLMNQFKRDGSYWQPGEIVKHRKVYP